MLLNSRCHIPSSSRRLHSLSRKYSGQLQARKDSVASLNEHFTRRLSASRKICSHLHSEIRIRAKEVFAYLNIQLPKGTPAYHLTWQFCYAARQEANKWTEGSEITQLTSHWTDILLDTKATNNIQFNTIDVIQAEAAHK